MKKVTKAIAAIMLMTVAVFATGCTKDLENEASYDVSGSYEGHDYVDLGLPSGTLWATCNVGATTPEGSGDFFAWGETAPKDTYNWSTYKYCEHIEYQYYKMTKYCPNSQYGYNGFTDDLTILQSEDDAATVNWGSGWCTPTKEQWQELIDNTTNEWATLNNVSGRVFHGKGRSLFLPAAGYHVDAIPDYNIHQGNYWLSSLTNSPEYAWFYHMNAGGHRLDGYSRYYGYSVRPVHNN